jgi:hypothetical protein
LPKRSGTVYGSISSVCSNQKNVKRLALILALKLIATSLLAQNAKWILTDTSIAGIVVGVSTMQDAASVFDPISYKKPSLIVRNIMWRGGGCSRVVVNRYYVKLNKDKLLITLRGDQKVNHITIDSDKPSNEISYQAIRLGKTRGSEAEVNLVNQIWQQEVADDGQVYSFLQKEGIRFEIKKRFAQERINPVKKRCISRIVISKRM